MTNVIAIPVRDNFTYLHPCGDGRAFVVDPGDASAVMQALQQHGLSLTAIALTHHHWDHVAGAADLQSQTRCEVIGVGRTLVPAPDRVVADDDVFTLGEAPSTSSRHRGTRETRCATTLPPKAARSGLYTQGIRSSWAAAAGCWKVTL